MTSRDGCWSIALKLVEIYFLFYSFVCRFIFCTQAVDVLIQDYNMNWDIRYHSGGNGLSPKREWPLQFPLHAGISNFLSANTSIARQWAKITHQIIKGLLILEEKQTLWKIFKVKWLQIPFARSENRVTEDSFGLQLTPEKKFRFFTGFEPLTSAIPVQHSTNWTNKPTGSRSLIGLL